MLELPLYIYILFGLTVLATILGFYWASKSKTFLIVCLSWVIVQSVLAYNGAFLELSVLPPRLIVIGIVPTLLAILLMFLTQRGRSFIDGIDLKKLTYMHTIRIPMEIVLVLLFHQGLINELQTFEGTNFDIISGITAPFVAYLWYRKPEKKKWLLIWNIVCLLLLLNVVITSALAFPTPLQQLGFDQPNIAMVYFPFNLLPAVVVPLVIFAHLISFRRLR